MKNRGLFYAAIFAAALTGGLLGGLNLTWSRHPPFPAYAWAIDLVLAPVLLGLILYARRLKRETTDEFDQTKKRHAAAFALMFGMIGFLLTNLFHPFFPQAYNAFMQALGTPEDGYEIGKVVGMAPFALGLLAGQVVAWMKYR